MGNDSESSSALRALVDVPATLDWVRALRDLPIARAVPLLLMRLERLSRAEVKPRVRLDLLRIIKRPVLKATAALPSPDPRRADGGLDAGKGFTVEQRLDLSMRTNLQVLFRELDRKRYSDPAATEENRHWVLRNLFKFQRRQVRYALLARRPCPRGTWQDLHDLFVYLVIRGSVRLDNSLRVDFLDDEFDAETEYKRLLMMGHVQQLDCSGPGILRMIPRLTEWSQGARLIDPGGLVGTFDLLLVEVSKDRPLRREGGSLNDAFRGWVFGPDRRFTEFCAREAGTGTPFARFRTP